MPRPRFLGQSEKGKKENTALLYKEEVQKEKEWLPNGQESTKVVKEEREKCV